MIPVLETHLVLIIPMKLAAEAHAALLASDPALPDSQPLFLRGRQEPVIEAARALCATLTSQFRLTHSVVGQDGVCVFRRGDDPEMPEAVRSALWPFVSESLMQAMVQRSGQYGLYIAEPNVIS